MLEKRLTAVSPQSLTSSGGTDGLISVADTSLFKVKQEVVLTANSLPNLDQIEIKRIISSNAMYVGPKGGNIDSRTNVSAYTTALNAKIFANEQKRPSIPFEEFTRAVYDEEPTVANRVVSVDKYGNYYTVDNPVPVQLSDGSVNIGTVNAELEVQLSHKDNYPNAGDIADSIRIGDGTNLITATTSGSKSGLDTYITNSSIDVNAELDAADGDNIGLKVQQRTLSPSDALYSKRATAITGSGLYADTTSLDVSLHDQNGNAYTLDNPLAVNSKEITNLLKTPSDFFGNTSVSTRTNQIEVPLDDVNWTNYVDTINANTGAVSQANGQVTLTTGTNINGRYAIISKDSVRYRPNSEIGWGFTWSIPTPSISGVVLRIGATDDATTWANSVYFGHENGTFSLTYRNNGSTIFSAQQSAWLDKCDGSSGSLYVDFTGTPVALNIAKDQLARIRAGLFGHAGFIVELLAPNQQWVTIYKYTNINNSQVPVFANFDLKIAAEVKKTADGTGLYTLSSACWAGWTGSILSRMNEPLSDRTLTQVTRTVIEGKSSAGGGTYIPVKVTPSGSLTISIGDIDGVKGQKTMSESMPITIASDQTPVDAGVVLGDQYVPNTPDTGTVQTRLLTDPDNQLKVRGNVLTDEGTFRDDFSGNSLSSIWTAQQTGNATLAVSNSLATLGSGTQNGNISLISTNGDYGPISFRSSFYISQRIANQTIDVGFKDTATGQQVGAYFRFTGTSNLTVDCITQSSSDISDIQTTTATYSKGFTSGVFSTYYIEVQPDQVSFIINDILVAQHKLHIPGPYDSMNIYGEIINSATVTNTNLILDYVYFINQNSVQINNSFDGDSLPVRLKTGTNYTYGAAVANFTYAANGTDIFTITGSDTRTVRIKHISIDGTQTSTAIRTVSLIKRSTQNTGGTSTILTNVAYDSSNPVGTATIRYYTANPTTLGTTVGNIHVEKLIIPSTSATVEDALIFSTVSANNSQDITLRGSSEVLAINMGGVSSNGNLMNVDVMWTEE